MHPALISSKLLRVKHGDDLVCHTGTGRFCSFRTQTHARMHPIGLLLLLLLA